MKAKDLMTANVLTVKPGDTVSEVAALLTDHRFSGVPVVDEEGKIVGMISERDFISSESKIYLPTYIKLLQEMDFVRNDENRLPGEVENIVNATAGDVMVKDLVTVTPETSISEITDLFAEKRVNPIPVVDENNKLVGIIARSDLIKLFSAKHFAL